MYIKVKVTAGANREEFKKIREDTFEAMVKEKAEGNRANKRVLELVANHLNIPVSHVKILNGHHSPSKLLVIRD